MSLNKIYKKIPFKVPKDYFESFSANFFIEQELKNKVQKTVFKTPDGYLNDFNV